MPNIPSNAADERKFVKEVKNHAEFRRKLNELSLLSDLQVYDSKIEAVARCWFALAKEHLNEAGFAAAGKQTRSGYSRAYYAAYNASKAVRYFVNGEVSLKGDDHAKASDLPNDFPDVPKWPAQIASLYEHRLRADYDNWTNSSSENNLTVDQCVHIADDFIKECDSYIRTKFNVTL